MIKEDKDRKIQARQRYFDRTVHHPKIKDCISGKNEKRVISLLDSLGYVLSKDYVRQHPIGERFVLDFAFLREQIALEIDGRDHREILQKKKDRQRDSYLLSINWIPIRIKDEELFGYKGSFFRSLIRVIVEERRDQWQTGLLYPVDFPKFVEEDYE